jgi:pimeloyl-ACP methyl ester carboxylesterase
MGGKIALALAARRPPALRALVLVAPSPPTPEPIEEDMRARLIAGWGCYGPASETLARVTRRSLEGALREQTIADMMNASKSAWVAWLQHGSREDISAAVRRIEVPVTILSGDADAAVPRALIEQEVMARLPHARLVSVPGAGHLLPLEAPDAVAAAIERSSDEPEPASREPERRGIAMASA